MDSEHWISRLAAAKRFYAAQLGHADRAGLDELDMDGDENAGRPDLACPSCYEDHDVASLIAHHEEEHPFEPHAAVKIRRLEKQREVERRKIEELKSKNADGQPGLL